MNHLLVLLFAGLLFAKTEAHVYSRCELAKALLSQGVPRNQLENCKIFNIIFEELKRTSTETLKRNILIKLIKL